MFDSLPTYVPFAVNLVFLGVGYWAGTRGPAKLWQDISGDIANIKSKLESLNAKVTVAPVVVAPAAPVA